jgi:membrane associated rhomboid family serine protease
MGQKVELTGGASAGVPSSQPAVVQAPLVGPPVQAYVAKRQETGREPWMDLSTSLRIASIVLGLGSVAMGALAFYYHFGAGNDAAWLGCVIGCISAGIIGYGLWKAAEAEA